MCASPFRLLRAGPPPPNVALLPDALFFTRVVPVTPGAMPTEAASQIELALEAVSPFPLTQLYYGWFWKPGAEQALVFAAYRRRFTAEQTADWERAELVLPAFAAVLGASVEPSTTIVLTALEGLTLVHWTDASAPSRVEFRPIDPETNEEDRAKIRDEVLRDLGGSKKVVELESPLMADAGASDREVVFRAGDFVSRLSTATAAAVDIRDKAELAALRNAQKRDVLLWRVTLGAAAALLLLALGEGALVGGRAWQQVRVRQYTAQKSHVDRIEGIFDLTNRIEDLSTKRLLPLEMVTQLVGVDNERLPEDIQFTRVQAEQSRGLYSVFIEGKTNNPAQVTAYANAVRNLPTVESVDPKFSQVSGDRATFTLAVTFKTGALNPTGGPAVTSTP